MPFLGLNFSVNKKQLEDFYDSMEEKYRENFCLGVVLSRQIQRILCVNFNKNKYEGGSYTISNEGTRNLPVWESTDLLEMVN